MENSDTRIGNNTQRVFHVQFSAYATVGGWSYFTRAWHLSKTASWACVCPSLPV